MKLTRYEGTIYAIVPNNTKRYYIGSTMKPIQKRISSGIGYKYTNPELYRDMRSGWKIKILKRFVGLNYDKVEQLTTEYETRLIVDGWYKYNHKLSNKQLYNKSIGSRKRGK